MTDALLSPLSEWASLFFASLADAGLTDVVASPGSRSTPFVLAAARESRLRVHDVIDERSAAFFALGLARATGRPAALLCTSGTAGAHYLPAVVEASAAWVPLLLLTADRPLELQACCAAQTIDQVKLFGDHARLYLDPGTPDGSVGGLRALRRLAAQAVHVSQHPTPGPVHVNLRARKPLEPVPARDAAEETYARAARDLRRRPLPVPAVSATAPSIEVLTPIAAALERAERGVIVAGPASLLARSDRDAVRALALATGFPLLADVSSQLRVEATGALAASDLLLASPALRAADCVIQIGAAPITSAWEGLVASPSVRTHVVVAAHGWHDAASTATHLVASGPGPACAALANLCAVQHDRADRAAWGAQLATHDRAARAAVAELVPDRDEPSEASVARACLEMAPANALVVLGNSLPIRSVEAWTGLSRDGLGFLTQRGANGIDGLVSSAAGAAASDRPTLLLLGDVSALHDLGGLAVASRAKAPLAIVVVDNGGGRIFEQLPVARVGLGDAELAHFTTPHALDFAAAARAFGVRYERPATMAAVKEALRSALEHPGATLVHVEVPAHEEAALRAELQRRVEAVTR